MTRTNLICMTMVAACTSFMLVGNVRADDDEIVFEIEDVEEAEAAAAAGDGAEIEFDEE